MLIAVDIINSNKLDESPLSSIGTISVLSDYISINLYSSARSVRITRTVCVPWRHTLTHSRSVSDGPRCAQTSQCQCWPILVSCDCTAWYNNLVRKQLLWWRPCHLLMALICLYWNLYPTISTASSSITCHSALCHFRPFPSTNRSAYPGVQASHTISQRMSPFRRWGATTQTTLKKKPPFIMPRRRAGPHHSRSLYTTPRSLPAMHGMRSRDGTDGNAITSGTFFVSQFCEHANDVWHMSFIKFRWPPRDPTEIPPTCRIDYVMHCRNACVCIPIRVKSFLENAHYQGAIPRIHVIMYAEPVTPGPSHPPPWRVRLHFLCCTQSFSPPRTTLPENEIVVHYLEEWSVSVSDEGKKRRHEHLFRKRNI